MMRAIIAGMRKWMLLAAIVISVAISAQPKRDAPPPAKRHFEVHVTPEMIRHSRIYDVLYFVDFGYGIGVLLLILGTGWSARMRAFASRVRWPFVAAMLYFVLLSLVTAILTFPLDLYGGFIVPHQFDLTNQSFAAWMGDFGKAVGVNLVIFTPLAAIVLVVIRRARRWRFALWLGSI